MFFFWKLNNLSHHLPEYNLQIKTGYWMLKLYIYTFDNTYKKAKTDIKCFITKCNKQFFKDIIANFIQTLLTSR